MESHITQHEPLPSTATLAATSCRKKKNEQATFLEDLKDHIDDEHKTCFKKTMQKTLGMSKNVAERSVDTTKLRVLCPFKPQWQIRTSSLAIYRQIP